jgi:curved DNA-binding protein CbpA
MIPKEWEGKDFYQVLGIMRDARMEDIKAAHRRLVRAFHPDLAPSADSAEKFRAVTLAYEVLGNPTLRAQYDEYFFTDSRDNFAGSALYKKRRPFLRLLGRAAIFILILVLLRNFGYLGNTTIINSAGNPVTSGNSSGNNNHTVLARVLYSS